MNKPSLNATQREAPGAFDTAPAVVAPNLLVLDPHMRSLYSLIERLGPSLVPILVLGETGTGKEVLADWVHRTSRLRERPLSKINCAGLSESVVESELFGHERGAFTGAVRAHCGLFEAADGGTLFLDEVAELPLRTQAKLLRVLESGEFTRLGSTSPRKTSVRLIAATHRDLGRLVAAGDFRRDLFFRLNGAVVEIPSLRERPSEIIPLSRSFLERAAKRMDKGKLELDPAAEQLLLRYDWPGNVRELRNVIECAAALCRGRVITSDGLTVGRPLSVSSPPAPQKDDGKTNAPAQHSPNLRRAVQLFERAKIVAALQQSQGNQTRAAVLLGISRRTLTNKINSHRIERLHWARRASPEAGSGALAGGASSNGEVGD